MNFEQLTNMHIVIWKIFFRNLMVVLEQKVFIFSLREDYRRKTSQPYVQICIQVCVLALLHFRSSCASRQ